MCKTPFTCKLFSDHSNGNLNFKSYNKTILNTEIGEELVYKPKTKETRLIYE